MEQNTHPQNFAHEVISNEEKQNELDDILLTSALVTEIELKNGKKTKIITIYNGCDICFEELNIGVQTALEISHQTQSMKSTVCTILNGKIKESIWFKKSDIKHRHSYELYKEKEAI